MSNGIRSERTRLAVAGARSVSAEMSRQPRAEVAMGGGFLALLLLAVSIALLGLALLLIDAVVDGSGRFGLDLFTKKASSLPARAGFQDAILGTLWVIGGVIVFCVPIGVGAALYLEEYAAKERWWNQLVEVNIQNLAAVPSIVYGILGLAFIVRGPLDLGFIVLAASLTLTLLVLPTVIIAGREAIRAVPDSIRQGSLALGATRWQTIRHQILPAAIPGVMTGIILAISRAIGESAPLLLLGAATFVTANPTSPFTDGYTTLPVQIFNFFARAQDEYIALAAAGIIVMLVVLLAMNSFAIWLRNRYEQRW
ncbi:MAG TPA: phosphate ABC transporter permease PstA [Solirubrobacterales bacterium]